MERVGSLEEKLKAAFKMNVKLAILPKECRTEALLVTPPGLKVEYVSNVFELVSKAFERPKDAPKPGEF